MAKRSRAERLAAMSPEEREAFALANEGIRLGAEGHKAASLLQWQAAAEIADLHLRHRSIRYWIHGGRAEALFANGRFRECVEAALIARDFCLSIRQPAASLWIAKSLLALGAARQAAPYLQEVHGLVGEQFYAAIDVDHHPQVRALLAI
ncbi:hypothetical protein R0381_000375 [Jeongeupia wiesaeckerbachi]|uniref:hypothetical protein n=1 Tax=Jeongeupia wiesaeckerbachi TaxID=3051218 RepID=UPI003D809E3D